MLPLETFFQCKNFLLTQFCIQELRMNMKSQTIPFVKIAFSVLIGLTLSIWVNPYIIIPIIGIGAIFIHLYEKFKNSGLWLMISLITYVLGYVTFHYNPFQNIDQQFFHWKGIVIEKGQQFSKGTKYLIKISNVSNEAENQKIEGKVLLMSQTSEVYKLGEVIEFKGKCNLVSYQDTGFWDKINYKKGIQAVVWSDKINKSNEIQPFYYHLGKMQNYFESKLQQTIENPKAFALANGILLGDKSYMDKETKTEFVESGAAHILAVSGLHVGILVLFLNFAFGFFFPQKIKFFFIIFCLLIYAVLTGLSPAVVRAVLMACLAILAKITNRTYFIVNILAFVFTLQLLIDPFLLFHLGFWLSYLAVVGIIFIQPQLIMETKNKFLKWLQDNLTVGIAAQVATLPILLGFLGKFPLLFVITNLITLPISIVATYVGFLLLFIAEIPFLNEITGIIANLLFSLVLSTNQMIANLSFSNWSFQPNIFAMLVSLAIFIVVVLYCYKKMQQKSTQSMLNFI